MSFANINIGASAGDHGGDPIRTAFQKINNNFQQITDGTVEVNIQAPVQSVAGRTGNVVLTANDIIGTVTQGQVLGLIQQTIADTSVSTFANDADYADTAYVDSAVSTAVGDLVGGAPAALDTLYEIANSLANNTSLSSSLTNSIGAVASNVTVLQSNVASINVSIATLQSNAAAQQSAIATNSGDIVTLFANAASQKSSLDTNATNIATLFANAASQNTSITDLWANAASQQSAIATNAADIVTLFANAASQDSSVVALWANAASQQSAIATNAADIVTLFANAASQKSSLDSLVANAGAQSDSIAANAGDIVTLFANAASQNTSITDLWANAGVQSGAIATNAGDIVTLFANAASQDASIGALEANVTAIQNTAPYTNANVAEYLPTYAGALTANTIGIGDNKTVTSSSTIAVINNNPDPAIPSNGVAQFVAKNGTLSQVVLDAVDNSNVPSFFLRRARGNLTVPAGVLTGDALGTFVAKGYTSSGFTQGRGAGLNVFAVQDFTETSQPANVVIYTTPVGSPSAVPTARFEANGSAVFSTGTQSTSPTTGPVQITGGIGIVGNINLSNSLNAAGAIYSASIETGPIVASDVIYATGIANDTWLWANGNPIMFGYANSDVTTYLAATSIVVDGITTDNWFWSNSDPVTMGYNDTNVQQYLAASDVVVNSIKTDTYQWANAAPLDFVTYTNGGINVGNVRIFERTIAATGGNTSPLNFDFPEVTVDHTLNVAETLIVNGTDESTAHNTGALIVSNGGMGVAGSLYVAAHENSRFQVGEGGQQLPNVLGQFSSNVDAYAQINMQNLSNGQYASSDFVATADNGDDSNYFIDMGIASSTYNYDGYTAIAPNDGYIIANGGDLLLNAASEYKNIKFAIGGSNAEHIVASWGNTALSMTTSISSESDISATGNVSGTYFNGNIVGTTGTITNIDSYTGYFASNLATSYMAFGGDPLNRNSGLLAQVVDSLGFVTEFNNGVILVNEQGSTEQNLFLGDTSITSNATLLGVSVTQGGGYYTVLNLTGNGQLHVPGVYSTLYGNVDYTPANSGDWDTPVTTVAQALDELANRLRNAGF